MIIMIGVLLNKVLSALKYQQKYLPIKKELELLLKSGFVIIRKKDNVLIKNPDKYKGQKFLLRLNTSDKNVLQQVIIDKGYMPIIKLIEDKGSIDSIKIIIDAGSNIGLTSIFFNGIFPSAKIISIEPDDSNYDQQIKNIKTNNLDSSITILKKALWVNNSDKLKLSNNFRDGKNWSKSIVLTSSSNETKTQSITLSEIIDKYVPDQIIDIFKIDVEGTEKELFNSIEFINAFTKSVRYFCIEIHDEFEIREHIMQVLKYNDFEYFDDGETTFGYNKKLH